MAKMHEIIGNARRGAGRSVAFGLAVALIGLLPEAALAQVREQVVTSGAYFGQLRGRDVEEPVRGPATATVVRDAAGAPSSEIVPIARLREMLAGCRAGAFRVGGSRDHSGRTVGTQSFECLGAGVPDKSMQVDAVLAPDMRSVEIVDVHLGKPVHWTPPAPTPPASQPPYDEAKFDGYRNEAHAFLARVAKGEAARDGASVPIKLADLTAGRAIDLSAARATEILAHCRPVFTVMAHFSVEEDKAPRDAVRVHMKCDARSSAPEDLHVWASFTNGRVDGVGIQAAHDYRVPPPAAAAEKQDG